MATLGVIGWWLTRPLNNVEVGPQATLLPNRPIKDKVQSLMAQTNWRFEPVSTNDHDLQHMIANTATFAFMATFPSDARISS